jgi:phosphoglycolate phosphatase-like HAD superfamily hydrolase
MIKAIISDSDGTLVNTLYLIRHGQYEAGVEYLLELGVPQSDIPPYSVYESYINKSVGGPTRDTVEKTLTMLFGKMHEHHLKKVDFDELDKRLKPIQDRISPLYVHPYHGLTELFSWTGNNNISLGIFTSGDRRMIIRHYGVSLPVLGYTELYKADDIPVNERFAAFVARAKAVYGMSHFEIVASDVLTKHKPDPEGILKLMQALRVKPEEVIVCGDLPVDMIAAKRAGVHSVGMAHGFGTPAELTEAGAIRVVGQLLEIPQLIEDHNNGKNKLF